MYKVLTLNKIAKCGINFFDKSYTISDNEKNPDAIVLRSYSMHDMELPEGLLAVARAGAGVNNIPIDKCSEKGIVVFNTPGANANAVKELVIASLLLSSRNIIDGINWAKTLKDKGSEVPKLVEKGKGEFAGQEIEGKILGIIGLGAIGVMVANAAAALGMRVIGYDPFISVDAAWNLNSEVKKAVDLKTVLSEADYISLHVPLNDSTKGMINDDSIVNLKNGVRLLNFSRAELVDDSAIAKALNEGKVACYVTDFPNEKSLEMKNVIPIPHLGASSQESEDNCAIMAVKEIVSYLEDGNIINSVNFPDCYMPKNTQLRFAIAHKNIPNMLSQFSAVIAAQGINIEDMINKSKKDLAFTLIDTNTEASDDIIEKLRSIEGVLKVRVIK